jgi:hypothetical protein
LIWVIAFLFYAVDSAKLLLPREMLLIETRRGGLRTSLSAVPFLIAGRPLYFCPLHLPQRAVYRAAWGSMTNDADLDTALESLRGRRKPLLPFRVVATVMFTLLFFVGPSLTLFLGPDTAIVYLAGFVYVVALGSAAAVWFLKDHLAVAPGHAIRLGLELVLCPAFVPNIVRRITCSWKIEADGVQLGMVASTPDLREQLVNRVEVRVGELLEDLPADDPEAERLRAYMAAVAAAR